MGIGGSAKSLSFGSSTPAVEDQDKPWLKLDGNGDSLGWHIYTGTKWAPIKPIGIIEDYEGDINAIPAGYVLCDGVGTYLDKDGNSVPVPDLRDRFVIGAGNTYSMSDTGGSDTSTFTVANFPTGNYIDIDDASTITGLSNIKGYNLGVDGGSLSYESPAAGQPGYQILKADTGGTSPTDISSQFRHGHTGSITGAADTPLSILPKYFAAAKIIYTAL